jgi:hypothetical protein
MRSHSSADGSANSKPRPSGNSASKKQAQRFATNSGTIPALESSYENVAAERSNVFWCPERVNAISMHERLPGEIVATLQCSDLAPRSTDSTRSVSFSCQEEKNRENASSIEQFTGDPLTNVFGPETASWLRERFPGLR